jgi:RNA polymerase sporulation-specific sigma factor
MIKAVMAGLEQFPGQGGQAVLFELMATITATLLRWLLASTGYLSGSNTFPQPLSDAEEASCLQLMAQGDVEARNRLVEHNLRLVAHMVNRMKKKFDTRSEETEDLISIGIIGLIKAINGFNQAKGTRLATFAARCIENEILMYFRWLRKRRGEASENDPIGVDREGNEMMLKDVLPDDAKDVVKQVDQRLEEESLVQSVRQLEARERAVLVWRYGLWGHSRLTQREIAKNLRISRSYVSRIERRALERVRQLLDAGACH